ncbi:6694_t:CDS:2 [Diversispora eburnea]|uniref:6694_t:CDS:1 n=1 Tax=Diversispora eburnea TaxID=1213867 RepID=A0A9N8V2G6_9GLOM|nr:6694_t:CDS:2 [Diversispora eburnea]
MVARSVTLALVTIYDFMYIRVVTLHTDSYKSAIPLLWILPLGRECCFWDDEKLKKKALCIRTYILCMDVQARMLLAQNGFDLSSSPSQATFDADNSDDEEIITADSRIIFHEMCNDSICSISKLPGATKIFKKLESFTSTISLDANLIGSLYESLTLVCDNILNMDLSFDLDSQEQLLTKLISVQNGKSASTGQFISLQELYIKDCHELQESDLIEIFNNNFNELRRFSFDCGKSLDADELLRQIAENVPESLETIMIKMYYYNPWIFSATV